MSNVLFVLGSFYPRASANGNCVWKIAEILQKKRDKVFCICERQNKEDSSTVAGIEIYYVDAYPQDKMREKHLHSEGLKKKTYIFLERVCAYARTIKTRNTFPVTNWMVENYYWKIEEICKNKKIDTIIAVNKPVDAVYAAVKYKINNPSIRLVSYMLDLVYGGHSNPLLKIETSKKKCVAIEEEIIQYSDLMIALDEHEKQYRREHAGSAEKIYYLGVPLLADHTGEKACRNNNRFTLVYAGAIDEQIRNPRFIAEVFRHVENIDLVMYVTDGIEYMRTVSKGTSHIMIKNRISSEELKKAYRDADAFLNIGNATKSQSPSKIIEYIGYGKPIISTYRIDQDTSVSILKDYPNALCIDERNEPANKAAKEISQFIIQAKPVEFEKIEEKYNRYLPDAFIKLMNINLHDQRGNKQNEKNRY